MTTSIEARKRYRSSEKGLATHRDYQRQWAADHPEAITERGRRYRQAHPDERRASREQFAVSHPDYRRAQNLKRLGLTVEDYNRMFAEQGGRCAICGRHQTDMTKRLTVDHDHETMVVRGLLCDQCNFVLGHAYDSPRVLIAAAAYLEAKR